MSVSYCSTTLCRGIEDKPEKIQPKLSECVDKRETSGSVSRSPGNESTPSTDQVSSRSSGACSVTPFYTSFHHTLNSPPIVLLRLFAAACSVLLAIGFYSFYSIFIMSLASSLLVTTIAVAVALLFPFPHTGGQGWLHTLPSLLTMWSHRAGQVTSHLLAILSVVTCIGCDMLLAVFFMLLSCIILGIIY